MLRLLPHGVCVLVCLLVASAAIGQTPIMDAMDYPTVEAARKAWQPSFLGGGQVDLMEGPGPDAPRALAVRSRWDQIKDRICIDRQVRMDLSRFGRIRLWVYVDQPQAIREAKIYIRSSQGWYSGSFTMVRAGWQRVSIDRMDFQEEDKPAGWHQVDGLRVSFWPKTTADANALADGPVTVAFAGLEASSAPVAVVRADSAIRRHSEEAGSIRQYHESACRLLAGAADFMALGDADVTHGGLTEAKVAVFPYNPDMPQDVAEATGKFIAGGGKVLLFYDVPQSLAAALGFADDGWAKSQYQGQFQAVAVDANLVAGAPGSFIQGSWNIHRPRVLPGGAKVAGWWVDANGCNTGLPAVTIAPGGMYVGHVLTDCDRPAKRRLLLSAIATLEPNLRTQITKSVIDSITRPCGFETLSDMQRFIESAKSQQLPPGRADRIGNLFDGVVAVTGGLRKIQDSTDPNALSDIMERCQKSEQDLIQAASLCFQPWPCKFRAMWCHSPWGVQGWDWDRSAAWAKENGCTALIVNLLWAGRAYYPSDVLPVDEEVKTRGDAIAQCLAACRKHGLELHVWKVNYNLANAPKRFVDSLRSAGRLQVDRNGKEVLWLDPSDEDNFRLERDSMLEVVRKYAVDGIHFDYIRYCDDQVNYSAGARKRFQRDTGIEAANWPADVISGPHAQVFGDWRREQITRLVREVSKQARDIRPEIKVSAAVFSNWPDCRQSVGQDWAKWVHEGYLDFVCPMDYTSEDITFEQWVKTQLAAVGGRVPVYPGLGVTASSSILSPVQAARQIDIARRLGAAGFVIFEYNTTTATTHLPLLRQGVLAP